MSSLVSEFLINPVLRQARRFSEISRSTLTGDGDDAPPPAQQQEDAMSEAEAEADVAGAPTVEPEHSDLADANADVDEDSSNSRPLSSSTQETRVGEPVALPVTPMASDNVARDHLGFPLSPKRTGPIPEDDGMRELRTRIQHINACDLSSTEKARLMHETLLEGYRASKTASHIETIIGDDGFPHNQPREHTSSPGPLESLKFWQNQIGEESAQERFMLTDDDIAPTFAPIRSPKNTSEQSSPTIPSSPPDTMDPPLGCQHYERNVKLQCSTCNKWYTCRFCHDAQEDHNLIRNQTRNMLCMLCATPQRASDVCINCGEIAAQYYCNICKLWENRQSKPIYHCNDCGICRRGLGLGKDFFHCKTCNACITTSIRSSHKCIERSTDCDCPICGEYMFTSPRPVVFMTCGHSIHKKCYDQHMKVSYKCPLCSKSLANMETQFRNLDLFIEGQPMPAEFRDTKAVILCNDCSARSTVPYHWLGLKCSICRSYNTVEIQILGGNSQQLEAVIAELNGPSGEATAEQQAETANLAPPAQTAPRPANWTANRRRHSSHAIEPEHFFPDRIARSLSPMGGGGEESLLAQMVADDDSEEDMLGFWRSNGEEEDDGSDGSGFDSSDDELDLEDDDDDEEEDIVLIGHR